MKAEGTTELSNIICHSTLKSVLLKSSLTYSYVKGYSRPSITLHIISPADNYIFTHLA